MTSFTVGIDLAKNVFSLHGVDAHGKVTLRKTVKRNKLLAALGNLPEDTLIGMEACSGAHHWARQFQKLGYTARIMASRFVTPYRKGGKNDNNDAEAICEAVGRPNMRFVSIKSPDQQSALCVHRLRQGLVRARTAQINQLRGLLMEFGIVIRKSRESVQREVPLILADAENDLPWVMRQLIEDAFKRLLQLNDDIADYDKMIHSLAQRTESAKKLLAIPGVGEMTATAIVASVSDAKQFKSCRHFTAWLGLTPKQHTTGGVVRLGRITRRGDIYLRTLLVHGAR
ncbi:IS110 family transposase, partial [Sansalvadorimonas sp. 2012CJ34-2]